jgi:hypothetical protein
LLPAGAFAGWGLHPLESAAFSLRTPAADACTAKKDQAVFSKFARSVLRHIRVASKQELKERIMAGIEDVNRYPDIHPWSYSHSRAAHPDTSGNAGCGR